MDELLPISLYPYGKYDRLSSADDNVNNARRCIQQNDIETMKLFINDETDFSELLKYAVCVNSLEIIRYLLENGADACTQNNFPMMVCVISDKPELLKLLVDYGASFHVENDYPFRYSAQEGNLENVKLLLELGVDIHVGDDFALLASTNDTGSGVTEFLIEHGANIHVDDEYCLRIAAGEGDYDIVKLLLELGADIHAKNDAALVNAIESRYPSLAVIKLLIEYGADINVINNNRYELDTSLEKIVNFLESNGANKENILRMLINANVY